MNKNIHRENYSVFISHSSADKIEYVDDLAREIKALGITVFYDTDVISWGDNLKKKIDKGLEICEFAVVVISPSYFDREWPEYEIQTLLNRQNEENKKLILPILHNVSKEDLISHYPSLKNITFKYSKKQSKKALAQELKLELDKRMIENKMSA